MSVVELTTEKNLTEGLYVESAYHNTIEGTDKGIWEVTIEIEGKHVNFKVGKGTGVTVMSLSLPLKKTGTSLCGPDHSCLKVLGETAIILPYQRRSSAQHINNLKKNLLGPPAIKALKLLPNVCTNDNGIISQYFSLFTGIGKFGEEYTINLKPNP